MIMKKTLAALAILSVFSLAGVFGQDSDLLSQASSVNTMNGYKAFEKTLAGSKDPFRDLYLGMALHNISETDPSVINQAVEKLNAVWKQKKNAVALAYLGSAVTIRAGDALAKGNLVGASTDLADGVKKMDEAVELDPDNDFIRILRMMNGLSLSIASPVSRYAEIEEDLEYFEKKKADLDKNILSLCWYCRGRLYMAQKERDQALSALEQAIRVSPGSGYSALAEDLLWELEE